MIFNYFCDIVFPSNKSFQKQKNQIKKDALTTTFCVQQSKTEGLLLFFLRVDSLFECFQQ